MDTTPAAPKFYKSDAVINDQLYAFTQTFRRDVFYVTKGKVYTNPIDQWDIAMKLIHDHYKHIGLYEIYPELQKDGTIHFHGEIRIKDRTKYYKTLNKCYHELGQSLLKRIDDPLKWKEYYLKDGELWKELLGDDRPYKVTNDIYKGYQEYLKESKKFKKTINVITMTNNQHRYQAIRYKTYANYVDPVYNLE